MKAARLLIECLEAEGVSKIFGIPGEENLDIMDEICSSKIEFVLTRHEQAAAFMAGTVGRLTGRPGVCLSTLGPGATNLVTGVADAFLSNLPLIALVGQAGIARRHPPHKQVLDLMTMFQPLTKRCIDVDRPDRTASAVREAFIMATAERSGPVMLQLPEDVMKMSVGVIPEVQVNHFLPPGELSALDKIRIALLSSSNPLVIVGHGAVRSNAVEEVRSFCRTWNLPTACTWMAAGVMPYDDPLSLGTIGMRNSDLVKDCFEPADLVLLVGYDATEFQPQYWNKGKKKTLLVIGEGGPGEAENFQMDITALGDLKGKLCMLQDGAVPKSNWAEGVRLILQRETEVLEQGPKGVVQALRRQLGRRDILVSDVGAHLIWLAKYYPTYEENTLLLQNGLISMGVAIPSAIAVRMIHPERKVVAAVGDGGFLMSSAELETAKRMGVNFVTVIFNDGGLGLIREKMQRGFGRSSNVDMGFPDIPTYARSFGAEGYSVEEEKFEDVLQDCLERDALAVIDVKVDYSHNCRLF
ncbi:MAG TPA: acetolactate synthase large subunit [Methanomassiliicoccales archaeon]|nr:acetolactate synthase large subunit [Methanomassiliicoccales archaeon]